MKFSKLSPLNHREIVSVMNECQQRLPFFKTTSQAREEMINALSQSDCQVIGFEQQGQLVGLASFRQSFQKVLFTSALVVTTYLRKRPQISYWLQQLEQVAKLARGPAIGLQLELVDPRLIQQLLTEGYELVTDSKVKSVFTKTLTYKTGLVLAGGGARGAYQIGAWRALEELAIDYHIVTGTSVGALNGGLMLQGESQAAEAMWNEIDTGNILSLPLSPNKGQFTMSQMLKDLQQFAWSAIVNQGVSTTPLQQLIANVLDEDKIRQEGKDLYICVTQVPQFKEVVISLRETAPGEFAQWLLASSSFFPAMAAAKIGGMYYIDGGYRNNIPVDVALDRGATELIVIDVKGPGLTKPVGLPSELPVVTVVSPWSLGTVLLFESQRSKWNQQLGYFETLKAFGRYRGYWYTFDHQITDPALKNWHRRLIQGVFGQLNQVEKEFFRNSVLLEELLKKIRKLYSDRGTVETISFYVLELVGKVLNIPPTSLYTVSKMEEAIQEALASEWLTVHQGHDRMLLSLQEWLKLYADESPLPTEKRQVVYLYQRLRENPHEPLLLSIARIVPELYFVAQTLIWLTN